MGVDSFRSAVALPFRSARLGLLMLPSLDSDGGKMVDLSLRLNVFAVCAAIVFVGAILFGAF